MSQTQVSGDMIAANNKTVQRVYTSITAIASGTTTMPQDDTIPQNTEGDEYITLAITPTNASNILVIEGVLNTSQSGATNSIYAIFQDSTASALSSNMDRLDTSNGAAVNYFRHIMVAGTTSETTFKLRAGGTGGTFRINSQDAGRRFGGTQSTNMSITEYEV